MAYEPPSTPIWLADANYPAPCPCGKPMFSGEPLAMVESPNGLKTIMHASCLQMYLMDEEEDEDE